MKISEIRVERLAAWVIVGAGALLLFRLYAGLIFGIALPFLLAWGAAYTVRPVAVRLSRRLHMPSGACSVALVFLAVLLASVGLFLLARRAVLELFSVAEHLSAEGIASFLAPLTSWWAGLATRFPILGSLGLGGEGGAQLVGRISEGLLTALGEWAAARAASLATALPLWSLFLFVSLVAAFYFARDLSSIHETLLSYLPAGAVRLLRRVKDGAWWTVGSYLRAYGLIMLLTFFVLVVGFLLLGVRYALLLAALFAILDFLPVIGVGMLLVPWGIYALLAGDSFLGIGILVLWVVISVVRQFAEPRILGKNLGIHPLLTLLAMYAGLRLFGFAGLVLLPMVAVTLRGLLVAPDAKEPGDRQG